MSGSGAFAFRLATPAGQGAIAVIDITGNVSAGLGALGCTTPAVGAVVLRDLGGVDTGLVARWSDGHAAVMPHAGPFIVSRLLARLGDAGGARADADDPALWPEAADMVEARMLATLARAASPLAMDLLLAQPRRWRAWDGAAPTPEEIRRQSALLDRLVDPPLVVALGASNIGKSTLVNALAAEEVSIVADEPGVTRDHVGVLLTLDGLTVRWVDTPGVRESSISSEVEAIGLAAGLARTADLLALCADAQSGFVPEAVLGALGVQADAPALRVGLRADRGPSPGAEVQTAAGAGGSGLTDLRAAVRERLVPAATLAWPGPWAMGGCDPASLQGGGGSPTLACSDK